MQIVKPSSHLRTKAKDRLTGRDDVLLKATSGCAAAGPPLDDLQDGSSGNWELKENTNNHQRKEELNPGPRVYDTAF